MNMAVLKDVSWSERRNRSHLVKLGGSTAVAVRLSELCRAKKVLPYSKLRAPA